MRRETKMVYSYVCKCLECSELKTIYYTVADFGDSPHIMQCKHCGELYWYTTDDEAYLKPLDEQLMGLSCENCKVELRNSLTPTHKDIKCCGEYFSLDDDFIGKSIPSSITMVPIEVYMIYS